MKEQGGPPNVVIIAEMRVGSWGGREGGLGFFFAEVFEVQAFDSLAERAQLFELFG